MRLPLDTLKLLFSNIDISLTATHVETKYVNSGKGRHRYPVRSMLLSLMFMRFEAVPSLRKLCRKLERRNYAREICEFQGDKAPKHNTFSLFISRAGPETIEGLFTELRDQAFKMNIVDKDQAVKVSLDSTFMKANSRRGQERRHKRPRRKSWQDRPQKLRVRLESPRRHIHVGFAVNLRC